MSRIASFDIGRKNFAQYVEDVDINKLQELNEEYFNLDKSLRRRTKGPMNPQISKILKECYKSGNRVSIGVYDLSDQSSDRYSLLARDKLLEHLENFRELWNTCDQFIIELQYFATYTGKGKKSGSEANVDAIKISEGVFMWFKINYSDKYIDFFPSTNKTQILGAPNSLTKPQRKKWVEEKSRNIFELRNDEDMLELFFFKDKIFRKRMNTEEQKKYYISLFKINDEDLKTIVYNTVYFKQKWDDFLDAVGQLQAYKYRKYIGNF